MWKVISKCGKHRYENVYVHLISCWNYIQAVEKWKFPNQKWTFEIVRV